MWLEKAHVLLVALNHEGNVVWRRDVGPYEEVHGFGKSPMVVDDLVCVANDSDAESAMVAFDRHSGEVRWKLPRKSGTTSFGTPCVADLAAKNKQIITSCTASGLTAINITTGKSVWQAFEDDLTTRCVSSPIVANGIILVACGEGGSGKVLIAARLGDGESPPQVVYRLTKSVPQVPTVVTRGDLVFLWHDRGVVSCCELATGKQVWRERVGGDFHSSPIRAGTKIFCCSRQGDVVVLAADKEYKLLARNSLKETCVATPAIAHHHLYVRTDAGLYCIGQPVSK
jgi:outer membrane protein assembly factor BamB